MTHFAVSHRRGDDGGGVARLARSQQPLEFWSEQGWRLVVAGGDAAPSQDDQDAIQRQLLSQDFEKVDSWRKV